MGQEASLSDGEEDKPIRGQLECAPSGGTWSVPISSWNGSARKACPWKESKSGSYASLESLPPRLLGLHLVAQPSAVCPTHQGVHGAAHQGVHGAAFVETGASVFCS